MAETTFLILILVILFALLFDYVNGFNDAANAIATCISTKALTIPAAVAMAAILNFVGAMISTKVAATIGQGIVSVHAINQIVILASVTGAIVWSIITWYFGIPSSSTHALIGGLIGAATAHTGLASLQWFEIKKIIFSLLLSPVVGLFLGFWMIVGLFWLVKNLPPEKLNKNFRRLQIISAAFVAISHGTADAQKSMGIITMALLNYGVISTFQVPTIVVFSCALVISIGTAIGGWRIIKTIGSDFVKLQPIHGFCVQTVTAGVVLFASACGLPTSTTHVVTSSILGAGLAKGINAVNWKIARNVVIAWVLTIPAAGTVSFLSYAVLNEIFHKI